VSLAFDILTSSADIATPGDKIASRWVKRRHYNAYSGQEIVQEFQIYFVKSLYCKAKTASLVTPSTLDLSDAIVGTSKTILSQLDTNSDELVLTGNDSSHCQYTAACQIFDSITQRWIDLADWIEDGISCDNTGEWTVNIATSNNNYNPSTTLVMRVIYEILDS